MARRKAVKKESKKAGCVVKQHRVTVETDKAIDTLGIEAALIYMSSKEPWQDGFHQGIEGNELAIELEFGKHIRKLVNELKPDVIVDVGTGPGYAAAWMNLALEENEKGRLFTIDNLPGERIEAIHGSRRVEFLGGTLQEHLSKLPKKIDFAFLDSDHQIDAIARDVEDLLPRLSKGAIVCVHDVNLYREMGNLLPLFFRGENTFALNNCDVKAQKEGTWEYLEISNACGLGIAKKLK